MRLALQVVSVAVALLAAWFWWRAWHQPLQAAFDLRASGELDPALQQRLRSSARWNGWAARCTAVAVVLQAASGFWH